MSSILYKDKLLWLAGYPVIALSFIFIANDNSFDTLIHIPSFYSDILFAFIVTFLAGIYIKNLVKKLDKSNPWEAGFKKRTALQFLQGILIPLIAVIGLELFYLEMIDISVSFYSIMNFELPLAFLFLVLANAFYLLQYLFLLHKTQPFIEPSKALEITSGPVSHIAVMKGFTEELVDISACALISTSNKLTWLHTFNGDRFRLQGTLEDWQKKLSQNNFYRINRQYLAGQGSITKVEITDTRTLKLTFAVDGNETVFVSKQNAASFRQWWKNECPVQMVC